MIEDAHDPDWSTARLGSKFREIDHRVGSRSDLPLLAVSQKVGVVRRDLLSSGPPSADDYSKYKRAEAGDLVLNRFNAYRGALGVSTEEGMVSPDYLVLRPRAADPRFLEYLLRSDLVASWMQQTMGGIGAADPNASGFARIDIRQVSRLWTPLPRLELQKNISAFLDRELKAIDHFIADQEQLLRLLGERRLATLSEAVTQGVKSGGGQGGETSARVTETGLEWPKTIPATWLRCTVRNVFRVLDCKHVTAAFFDDGEYPVASIREVKGDWVDLTNARRTDNRSFAALTEGGRAPIAGDLIVSRNASVGDAALVPKGLGPFAMGQDVSLIRDPIHGSRTRFLAHVLRSKLGSDAFATASVGSTFKRINVDDIKGLAFWMPPTVSEMEEISDYVEAETAEVDAAMTEAREAIALTRERRAALISAAVTGKIDVDHA